VLASTYVATTFRFLPEANKPQGAPK
jgi:hypothetical protein